MNTALRHYATLTLGLIVLLVGSWLTGPTALHAQAIEVQLPDASGSVGGQIEISVQVSDLTDKDITSYQFTLPYDAAVLSVTGINVDGAITPSKPVANTQNEGEVKVSFAQATALEGEGTLLNLEAELVGGGTAALSFSEFRFFNSDAEEVESTTTDGSVTVEADEAPDSPGGLSAAIEGGQVNLSWAANSESDLAGYNVYRSTSSFSNRSAASQLNTSLVADSSYSDAGVTVGTTYYYRITAVDDNGGESGLSEEVKAFVVPADVAVSVSQSFGDASSEQNYRLVALPGAIDQDLGAALQGDANAGWQAWWDDGTEQDFLKRYDGSSTFHFRPGRGFWLISQDDWQVDETLETVSLQGDGMATISLHEGWNIISNPLDEDVAWSAITEVNGSNLQTLWQWDGSFSTTDTFRSAKNGEAFYFLNDQGLAELAIPYPGSPSDPGGAAGVKGLSVEGGRSFLLTAYHGDQRLSELRVGVSSEAKDGLDDLDQFAPPIHFEAASLRLKTPEAPGSNRLRYLAHEYRPPDRQGQTFDLVLHGKPGETVRLEASALEAFQGREVVLINRQTGRSHDLQNSSSMTLTPQHETTEFRLAVGTEAFVDGEKARALPRQLELHSNYPNPFSGQTTLEYALPERAEVEAEVYDILGRQVRVLQQGAQRAGFHRVQWNGRNSVGQPVVSGLYFVRFKAMGQERVQKVTLVR